MNSIDELKTFVLKQTAIVNEPGKLLYSSGKTLKQHPVYSLGTNPGGTLKTTIRDSLDDLDNDKNEYLDYSWAGRLPGKAKLQKQIQRYIGGLGFDLRHVPASNIVLTRDRSITTHKDLNGDAQNCWPIHLFILDIVRPKNILAFGSGLEKSPFAYLKRFLKPKNVETINAGQGTFKCHRFIANINGIETGIIIVPHLSRYSPYKHDRIMNWVGEWL